MLTWERWYLRKTKQNPKAKKNPQKTPKQLQTKKLFMGTGKWAFHLRCSKRDEE